MTTKPKFTPGPWEVDRGLTRSGKNIVTRAVDGDGPYLIECPGSGGAMSLSETVCALNWTGTPEWDANAALIAAAPEMHEACDASVDVINAARCWFIRECEAQPDSGEVVSDDVRALFNALCEAQAKAEAALAKAEGRT